MRASQQFVAKGLIVSLVAGLLPLLLTGTSATAARSATEVSMPGGVVPVAPFRVLDTRVGNGAPQASVPSRGTVSFTVTGRGQIPGSGVGGVFLNVTATGATGSGFVAAYPGGGAVPGASNLNVRAGQTIPNMVFVPVGTGANAGKVSLYNGTTGSIQLLADSAGYVVAGAATEPGAAVPVSPARVLDTRVGTGAAKAPVAAGGFIDVQVAGKAGVPGSGASGVWLNVTVTQPTSSGFISVTPGGVSASSSNLNFSARQTIPNLVFVPLSAAGKVRLRNGSAGTSHLLADVAGFVRAGAASEAGTVAPVTPARVLDTRVGNGAPAVKVAAGGGVTLQVTGRGNIPAASQVAGVFLNVTVTQPSKAGYLSAFPAGITPPAASNLNFTAGQTIPNMAFVPVNNSGQVRLRNGSAGSIHLLADTAGYVRKSSTPPLKVTTTDLPDALAGAPYQVALGASGGAEPYEWTATGLPHGLTLDRQTGALSGHPTTTGTATPTVTVTDGDGSSASRKLSLDVPTAVPAECRNQECAVMTPAAKTIQLTATQTVSIGRGSDGKINEVTTTGLTISAGDTVVLPAGDIVESGAVSKVSSTSAGSGGTTVSMVTPSNLGAAFTSGTVITDPDSSRARTIINGRVVPQGDSVRTAAEVKCIGEASANVQVTVTPQLTGTLMAAWDFWQGLTTGFVSLDGSIEVGFDASMKIKGECNVTLPVVKVILPAAAAGTVVTTVKPSVKVEANASIEAQASARLVCSASYYWSKSNGSSPTKYCKTTVEPLKLSHAEAQATLTGTLDARVTLNEIGGLTGKLEASLTATDTPTANPVATLDAELRGTVGACLACWWDDGPFRVTFINGTIWKKRLWSLSEQPPPPTRPLVITTTSLPSGTVGEPYSATLAASGGGTPYRWSATGLPGGLTLNPNTGSITGTPTTGGLRTVDIEVTDSAGATASVSRTLAIEGGSTGGVGVKQVTTGTFHTCAVLTSGAVKCWGDNHAGQLGDGTQTGRLTPVQVSGLGAGVSSIAAGGSHTCAVLTSGAARCWGDNEYGQVGDGTDTVRPSPVQVSGLGVGVSSISAGNSHTCAVLDSGAAKCWGRNNHGALGVAPGSSGLTPVQVSGLGSGVLSISAGNSHTCAVLTSGAAKCWGDNEYGQVGDGTDTDRSSPVQVFGLSAGVSSITTGALHTCATLTSGAARCWGANHFDQLGVGHPYVEFSYTPVQVHGMGAGVSSITAGRITTCAVLTSGALECWGNNSYGIGSSTGLPEEVAGLGAGVSSSSAGDDHSCVVLTSGAANCWGYNWAGQVGDGTTTDRPTPVQVLGLE